MNDNSYIHFPGLFFHQSMAFYGGKALFFAPTEDGLNCNIYDFDTRSFDSHLVLPILGDYVPHANAACFSDVYLNSNSMFPALYVSAWDGDRCAYIYDIYQADENIDARLVQMIDPSQVSDSILGLGYLNWVVDAKNRRLYSIAYRLRFSDLVIKDNAIHLTCFKLPDINSEKVVVLKDSDILDNKVFPVINAFQDSFFDSERIFMVSGYSASENFFANKLHIINVENWSVSEYDILIQGEPEGLSEYKGNKFIFIPFADGETGRVYYLNKIIRNNSDNSI